jgi:hypothetical protein
MRIEPEQSRNASRSGGPVAVGKRIFWASLITRKMSSNGNPMIIVKFVCVCDELTDGLEEGKEIWERFVITPKAAWKLRQICFALQSQGFDSEDIIETENVLTSRPVYIDVKMSEYEYQGEKRTKPVCSLFERFSGHIDQEWEQVVIDSEQEYQKRNGISMDTPF